MIGELMMGLRGMAGPARSAAGGWAMRAGGAARAAWGTGAGRGAIIGAGAGAAWGAASDDTSVLGGMAMGALGGAGIGRYGGAGKAMWGSKYGQKLAGGARLEASARQAGVQLGADIRQAWGGAKSWWGGGASKVGVTPPTPMLPSGGASIASNAGVASSGAMAASLQSAPVGRGATLNANRSITELAAEQSRGWGQRPGAEFTLKAQKARARTRRKANPKATSITDLARESGVGY